MENSCAFKPWGELDWLLSKTTQKEFDLIACLSTEERCTNAYSILYNEGALKNIKFLEVIDPTDSSTHIDLREKNKTIISLPHQLFIEQHKLLEPVDIIVKSVHSFINSSNGNIILDISAFPKRFFFPITKVLFKSEKVNNLIITCSTPLEYTKENLSEDPQTWAHIPTFTPDDPDQKFDIAIVGIGFMPLGLPQLLKDKYSSLQVKFFFPFPPGPPTYQRTWAFVNHMNTSTRVDTRSIYRIDSLDLSENFEIIKGLANKGEKNVLFAPYGPKTMSLAMCLYACLTKSAVFYTQPTTYNPLYSTGTGKCFGYIIKQGGRSLYTV
jgi:hypothetical protein